MSDSFSLSSVSCVDYPSHALLLNTNKSPLSQLPASQPPSTTNRRLGAYLCVLLGLLEPGRNQNTTRRPLLLWRRIIKSFHNSFDPWLVASFYFLPLLYSELRGPRVDPSPRLSLMKAITLFSTAPTHAFPTYSCNERIATTSSQFRNVASTEQER